MIDQFLSTPEHILVPMRHYEAFKNMLSDIKIHPL